MAVGWGGGVARERRIMSRYLFPVFLLTALGLNPAVPVAGRTASAQDPAAVNVQQRPEATHPGRLGIGREARPHEIAGWNIDIRPDGTGLPDGRGSVKEGETLFSQRCAGCHGEFGEGVDRWPALAAGASPLTGDRPTKTLGSYWPYAATILDYVRRAQPFGDAQSLTNDELYAVVAYLLFINDAIDENFILTRDTLRKVKMPNAEGFYDDDREVTEQAFWDANPCMSNCKAKMTITSRARLLDATPAARVQSDDR